MTRPKDISTTATTAATDDYMVLDGATNGSRKILASNVGRSFRGALVKKAADQTAANYSAGGIVAWDAEEYDTDSIHDNSTNNSRLTVPSGVTKVRLSGMLYVSNLASSTEISFYVQKNGTGPFPGWGGTRTDTDGTDVYYGFTSAVVSVSSGDYFETQLYTTDTSITVNASGSWFAMEILG